MKTVILLDKKTRDRDYDKLFAKLDEVCILGRVASVSEGEVEEGYQVVLAYLPQEVMEWLGDRERKYKVV